MVDAIAGYSNNRRGSLTPEELGLLLVRAGQGDRKKAAVRAPRRISRRLDPDVVSEIVAKYEAGATSHELRAKYGLSQGSILKILSEHGVTRSRGGLSPEQRNKAKKLYRDGLGIQRIADDLGSNYTTVRRALLEAGVTMRGRLDYQQKR